jgi:hypothetical protein
MRVTYEAEFGINSEKYLTKQFSSTGVLTLNAGIKSLRATLTAEIFYWEF